ncbi:protein D3-like [Lutzomyia longipalpis]|uniref:protein D3-like n=1 Tax=Lutzomyia longipalpis TaxID=7200 RepID=UPI002483A1E3|nr:protein D3-like [Lutzomyia longipalpis]
MKNLSVVLLFAFVAFGGAFLGPDIPGVFRAARIVPNVIPVAPTRQLEVIYGTFNRVSLGEELSPAAVRNSPNVVKCILCGIRLTGFYTLVLIDPDAPRPDNPFEANFLHHMVVNVPGHRFGFGLHMGETVAEYVGTQQSQSTAFHRYIFLLYQQPTGRRLFNEPRINATETALRRNFALDTFVSKYGLQLVAGNFFQANPAA